MSRRQTLKLVDVVEPDDRSWLTRVGDALRSYRLPPTNLSNPNSSLISLFSGTPVTAGVYVNESSAMTLSTFYAAVSLIAGDCASLPLLLYRKDDNGGRTRATDNPLFDALRTVSNAETSAMTMRETVTAHALIRGNGFAEIVRDGAGRVREFTPLTPDRVSPFRASGGALKYEVANAGNSNVVLGAGDMIHLKGLSLDGVTGLSVVAQARQGIGAALAAEQFGASFFGNNCVFGGFLESSAGLTELARKNLLSGLQASHQGPSRAHKLTLLEEGVKFNSVGISPEDAQFIEGRVFSVSEIARWFGLPPTKLGDLSRATYSNSESESLQYFIGGLRRWLVRWESEIALKCIAPKDRSTLYVEHLVDAIVRGDMATRYNAYSQGRNGGWLSTNDIRAMENMPPIDGGDTYLQPLNMIPAKAPAAADETTKNVLKEANA